MKVVVTGASGFVGRPLCRRLAGLGMAVTAVTRRPGVVDGADILALGDIGPDTEWSAALAGADAVVHLAGQAHVPAGGDAGALAAMARLNRDATLKLAHDCAAAGVRRLVFLSSIKVNGEDAPADHPFTAADRPAPLDAYGRVKAETEAALAAVGGLEVVVIRPPLVHGPGAKGNLRALMAAVHKGLPLPLGAVTANRRSLVGAENLADAVALCLAHPAAAGQVYLVSDGEPVSTAGLVSRLAAGMGRRPLLVPVPPALLRMGGMLAGRPDAVRRLTGSLVVDDAPLRALGWAPRLSLDEGLAAMAAAFRR